MTGPEHYAEAERLLQPVTYMANMEPHEHPPSDASVARAQVHATLALVGITARSGPATPGWDEVLR